MNKRIRGKLNGKQVIVWLGIALLLGVLVLYSQQATFFTSSGIDYSTSLDCARIDNDYGSFYCSDPDYSSNVRLGDDLISFDLPELGCTKDTDYYSGTDCVTVKVFVNNDEYSLSDGDIITRDGYTIGLDIPSILFDDGVIDRFSYDVTLTIDPETIKVNEENINGFNINDRDAGQAVEINNGLVDGISVRLTDKVAQGLFYEEKFVTDTFMLSDKGNSKVVFVTLPTDRLGTGNIIRTYELNINGDWVQFYQTSSEYVVYPIDVDVPEYTTADSDNVFIGTANKRIDESVQTTQVTRIFNPIILIIVGVVLLLILSGLFKVLFKSKGNKNGKRGRL